MAGLIVATALVMLNRKIAEIRIETLKRKFKSKDFAHGIDRERMREIELLGLSLNGFMQLGLEAMKSAAEELSL